MPKLVQVPSFPSEHLWCRHLLSSREPSNGVAICVAIHPRAGRCSELTDSFWPRESSCPRYSPRAASFLVVLHISYLGCTGRASDRWRSPTASTLFTGANPSSDLVFGALILGQAKGCQPSITLSAIGRALLALVVLVLAEHVGPTETW